MKTLVRVVASLIIVFGVASLAVPSLRAEEQWWWVSHQNNVQSSGAYLRAWPAGTHVSEARTRIEALRWQDAVRANTIQRNTDYLGWEPTGKYAEHGLCRALGLSPRWAARTLL